MSTPPLRPGQYATADALAASAALEIEQESVPPAVAPSANQAAVPSDTSTPGDVKEKAPELTPAERWLKNIKDAGLTEAQANGILDAMMMQGFYEREYRLFRGRLLVTLRTREFYSIQRVANALDRLMNPNDLTVSRTRGRLELAGSLVKYGPVDRPTVLKHVSTKASPEEQSKAFEERLLFVDSCISESVGAAVFDTLAHFERIVWAVFSEGAAENF